MNTGDRLAYQLATETARDNVEERREADRKEVARQDAETRAKNAAASAYFDGPAESPDGREVKDILVGIRDAPDPGGYRDEPPVYVGPEPLARPSGDAVGAARSNVERRKEAQDIIRDLTAELRHVQEGAGKHAAILADAGMRTNLAGHAWREYYVRRALDAMRRFA